ncbi:1-aminocyclopropane-1-carboxylate deaminase/D-cysteine desulfhydrase [Pedobacter sp. BMA]|uniref:1-aminocyclopropane-1-carboxylate deaminase/D-cysteine desulfhydrase n=1 Tax=Pedobacter sp. BMA TaxID=1663685 RepID=UPI00064AFD9B|nr:pyridoxal-phosphate dependent enzyme [Pedobacter sp. BMA]KLT65731.1 1-aminocyclopropane-1-carboxylate deaminase [Pedobacter sp. BMA]
MFEKLNSPVEQLNYAPFSNLFVKRDDLIDPFISGNKWRKLKYILAKATAANKNHLVTFGGAYSNHLVATAAAAARTGLKATAFVRGEAVNNEMLMLCRLFGMELIFTDRESYRSKKELYGNYFADDPEAYFIDEGGASPEAAIGCAEIIQELPARYDHIFCAAGTGTTAAGLLAGIQKHELDTNLHVVSALKGGSFLMDEISSITPASAHLHLHTEYHFGGYAKTTPDLIYFIKNFTGQTGLLIDPVYTAKMFYAITDLRQKGILHQDDKILAIHTGGLLGMFGMKDKF